MTDVATAPMNEAANLVAPAPLPDSMPLLGLFLELDTAWRGFRQLHKRNEELAAIDGYMRSMAAEVSRLAMVERFTGRFSFQGDKLALFAHCLELARGAGLRWDEIVQAVNNCGEAGK